MIQPYIDSHAHLDFPAFDGERDAVLRRARDAGVGAVLTVGTDLEATKTCLEIASRFENVRASAGIHPHEAGQASPAALSDLEALARGGAAAVGEIGLDYYRDRSPRDLQQRAFRDQLDLASRLDLPVIIHTRQAWEDTIGILRQHPPPKRGVIHCFSGDADEAAEALALGFHLSFAGPLTYTNARKARKAAASVPLERLLIETDAPFLAPQSRRGKRNEPAFVTEVARVQARLHGVSPEDAGRVTSLNARTLFGLGPPVPPERIAYPIRDALYVNLTNRCTNRCRFCPRETRPVAGGHELALPAEPTVQEVLAAVSGAHPDRYREVVFCGFGEPTLRLDAVIDVGKRLREKGLHVRLDTNGTANLVAGRDVTPALASAVDEVSVSLNAHDAATYARLCRPSFGEGTFEAVVDFATSARTRIGNVTLSIVGGQDGVDEEACRRIAEEAGARFRLRPYKGKG